MRRRNGQNGYCRYKIVIYENERTVLKHFGNDLERMLIYIKKKMGVRI